MKKRRKPKPTPRRLCLTAAELNRAIAEVTSHKAQIERAIDELDTTTVRLHHAARAHEKLVQEVRRRGVLDREVEKAIDRLKVTFRNGPVLINESLVKLAQDILQEQIKSVLQDQIKNLIDELVKTIREEIQVEVSAAVCDAIEPTKDE